MIWPISHWRAALAPAALMVLVLASPAAARGKALDDDAFSAALAAARSSNPYQWAARLELLAKTKKLSKAQRASALFQLAQLYGGLAYDRPRAIATYQAMLKLDPKHPQAVRAKQNIEYANVQLGHIRARLARAPLGDIDDLMAVGDYQLVIDQFNAETRPRSASEIQARNLYYAGWFCRAAIGVTVGSQNTERFMVRPCPKRVDPIKVNPLKVF